MEVPMDALGIIRQIETDPALKAQMRAVLLGDELLALPAQVAQLIEGQREMQAAIRDLTESQREMQAAITGTIERQDRMEDTLTQLVQSQREMQAAITGTIERQDRMEDTLTQLVQSQREMQAAITALTESHQRLEMSHKRLIGDVSQLKGSDLEARVRNRLNTLLPDDFERATILADEEIKKRITAWNQKKTLKKPERMRIAQTDIIADARIADKPVTVVAEVSASVYPNDIERVAETARILQERGEQVRPLVFGNAIADDSVNVLAVSQDVELYILS